MPTRRTLRRSFIIFYALALLVSGTGISQAQEKSPSVKFNLFSVEGLVTGKTVKIDAAYGKKFNVPVPVNFSFLVPSKKGVVAYFKTPTTADGMLIKVSLATPDKQLIENFQFVTLSLPMGKLQYRLIRLTGLLANIAYNQAVAPFPQSKYIGARLVKIGQYRAIEVIGKYVDPKLGLMHVRIVGIPNPKGTDGVISIANVVAARVDIQRPYDLARTLSGTALRFFKFSDQ